jgi:hypothetical protein
VPHYQLQGMRYGAREIAFYQQLYVKITGKLALWIIGLRQGKDTSHHESDE